MSGQLMQTAEDERMMQAPLVDDGEPFGGNGAAKGSSSHTGSKQRTHAHSTSITATSSKPASSPSASSSPLPHSSTLPYPHPYVAHQANAIYLAPNASPTQLDGLTTDEEFQLRAHTSVFLTAIGVRLRLGQLAIATASVYLQVFFTHYSFKALDRLEIALTCLFLAGKAEERRLRVDHALGAYFVEKEELLKKLAMAAGNPNYAQRAVPAVDSPEWDRLRNRVYELESLVLDALEYNFEAIHPYSYLRKFLEKYIYSSLYAKESDAFIHRHVNTSGGLAQIAWNFINDSLRTSLCVRFSPSVICVVAIRMAMHHLMSQGKLAGEPVKAAHPIMHAPHATKLWHEELFGLSKKVVNKISSEILQVLETINETRTGNLASLLAVHRKAQQKSHVPLPCAKLPDLMATLQQKQQAAQHRPLPPRTLSQPQQSSTQTPSQLPPTNNANNNQFTATHPPSNANGPAHSDRKRPRSPERGRDREQRDRQPRQDDRKSSRPSGPAYSPLMCPPSPFIDAGIKIQGGWLPDLRSRPNQQAREREAREPRERDSRDQQRDASNRDRESRDHDRSSNRRRSRSRSRRSRSRSRRRSHSRDERRVKTEVSVKTEPQSHASPPEEGEVRDSTTALPIVREESTQSSQSSQSTMLLSPHARLASTSSLTKSCSTVTLSSQHSNGGGIVSQSISRLHSSVSMSNLASSQSDILSGDILRMSSRGCDSPLSTQIVADSNEEDIMRDITREANSLTQERREEQQQMTATSVTDDETERVKKRARVDAGLPTTAEFEGAYPTTTPVEIAPVTASHANGAESVAMAIESTNVDEMKTEPTSTATQQPSMLSPTSCKLAQSSHDATTTSAASFEECKMSLLAH